MRTSFVDGAWEEGTDTDVDEAPRAIIDAPPAPLPPPPVPPAYAPSPPEVGRVQEGSVTEVDTLLEAVDDDMDTTLATVRRADLEPMLGAPPPEASPYYSPGPPPGATPYAAPPSPAAYPEPAPPPAAPSAEPPVDVAAAPVEPPPPSSAPVGVAPPYAQVDLRYTGEPPAAIVGATPGVGAALGLKVRLLGGAVPMWLPFVLLLAVIGVGSVVLGFVLGRASHPARPATSAASPPAPSAAPVASAAPPIPSSLIGRAASGEPAALKELEGRPELDTEATLAVSRGKMMQRRQELEKLGASLKAKPQLAADSAVRKQLLSAARDPETARTALRIMATLASSDGPDLLYETWTGTPRRTETTRLAEQLVHEKDVRSRASPALAVALDLRDATTCEANQKLLAAAKDHGDRRSLHQLAMLQRKFGCGPRKKDDCYKCLRDNDDLVDAVKAVRHRAAPKF